MAGPIYADCVKETTTTTGTGTLTLAGAVAGYQSFSVVGNSNICEFRIEAVDGSGVPTGQWEVTRGTYTTAGTTLSRTTVLDGSSGAATLVNFSAGTKNVFLVDPSVVIKNQGAKGWVAYNGSTNAIRASYNVSSVTDNGTGDFTINWDTDFSSANYCILGLGSSNQSTYYDTCWVDNSNAPAAGTTRVRVGYIGIGYTDDPYTMVAAFGSQ